MVAENQAMTTLTAKPEPVEIDFKESAVIVVDMQNAFASPKGMLDLAGIDISGAAQVVRLEEPAGVVAESPAVATCRKGARSPAGAAAQSKARRSAVAGARPDRSPWVAAAARGKERHFGIVIAAGRTAAKHSAAEWIAASCIAAKR